MGYVARILEPQERQEIIDHLEGCKRCNVKLDQLMIPELNQADLAEEETAEDEAAVEIAKLDRDERREFPGITGEDDPCGADDE